MFDVGFGHFGHIACIYFQISSPKKLVFLPKEILSKIFLTYFCLYSMQLFSADPKIFSKKLQINFLSMKTLKKTGLKVAHNWPRPFYFTVQPRPQPTAQNWFFILWNLGTRHLFSYLCFVLGLHPEKSWIYTSDATFKISFQSAD